MKNKNSYRSRKCRAVIASFCLSAMLLTGCAKENTVVDSYVEESQTSNTVKRENLNSNLGEIAVCTLDTNDMFSDRDKEVGFDEGSDTIIYLKGDTASCTSDAVQISGSTVTITDEGTYILSGTLNNGSIVVDAEDSDKPQLVLNGVDITCDTSAAIYVKQADKVFLTLPQGTENYLETSGEFVAIDDNNIDAVVFSKDDLTLNGSGSLQLKCEKGHGIVSKDDLVFVGGNYQINVANHGISGKDSVRVADGTFDIHAGEDGIHSENDDDMTLGFVYIANGDITIAVSDDGIHAGNQVLIENGNVNIAECEEGIEGLTVDIAGGNVTVNAKDDGLNATDGSSSETTANTPDNPFAATENAYIKISGGVLKVTAYGDGIDSNGALYVTGGETYVSGPENSGNGSLDYASTGLITGGIFVAAGTSGMAQNFGNSSTQCAMMVNLNAIQQAGTSFSLKDASGEELVSFCPENKYNCVIISCPALQTGNIYRLIADAESIDIEMTDIIYGNGMMGGGMGGKMPGGRGEMNGNMNGEMPPMPEGEFDGEIPPMPEGERNGEMLRRPGI